MTVSVLQQRAQVQLAEHATVDHRAGRGGGGEVDGGRGAAEEALRLQDLRAGDGRVAEGGVDARLPPHPGEGAGEGGAGDVGEADHGGERRRGLARHPGGGVPLESGADSLGGWQRGEVLVLHAHRIALDQGGEGLGALVGAAVELGAVDAEPLVLEGVGEL
ncbi:MAG TPA: hypothetical protein VGE42_08340, partial [Candidatus Dormibacteraeota bacterium]